MHLSLHLSLHQSLNKFISPSSDLSIHWTVCPPICLFISRSIHQLMHPSLHPSESVPALDLFNSKKDLVIISYYAHGHISDPKSRIFLIHSIYVLPVLTGISSYYLRSTLSCKKTKAVIFTKLNTILQTIVNKWMLRFLKLTEMLWFQFNGIVDEKMKEYEDQRKMLEEAILEAQAALEPYSNVLGNMSTDALLQTSGEEGYQKWVQRSSDMYLN